MIHYVSQWLKTTASAKLCNSAKQGGGGGGEFFLTERNISSASSLSDFFNNDFIVNYKQFTQGDRPQERNEPNKGSQPFLLLVFFFTQKTRQIRQKGCNFKWRTGFLLSSKQLNLPEPDDKDSFDAIFLLLIWEWFPLK